MLPLKFIACTVLASTIDQRRADLLKLNVRKVFERRH